MTVAARIGLVTVLALTVAACSGDDATSSGATSGSATSGSATSSGATSSEPAVSLVGATAEDQFPTVQDVVADQNDDGTWNFSVTMTSPYDTPDRYADGWRVLGPDGTEYGTHTLTHDHAAEQPFTRRQVDVAVPDDVDKVTVEGRDLVNGFGGGTYTVDLIGDG